MTQMRKKTAEYYYWKCLTLAIEGKLPDELSNDSQYGDMFTYFVELFNEEYIDGHSIRDLNIIRHPAITKKGRHYLEELEAKKPLARLKAKGLELLWIGLTTVIVSVITAIVTTRVTLHLSKPVASHDTGTNTAPLVKSTATNTPANP